MRRPRVALFAAGLTAGLAACHRQPSFDERYAAAQHAIVATAASIDADLAARASEAAAADAAASRAPSSPPPPASR